MDDLGFDDVGYGNADGAVATPHIDALAKEGVTLSRYYSAFSCTPARGALLTGLSPHRLGLQHGQVFPEQPWGLPSKFSILPQHLAKLGYRSHLVGKWHLGHFSAERLPTARALRAQGRGIDRRTGEPTRRRNLFLLLSFNAVHAPVWAPEDTYETHPDLLNVTNGNRRKFAAALRLVDDAVGNVVAALEEARMDANSILIFASDNGANPEHGGSNAPLRGSKGYLFEGGVRVPAFVRAPKYLPRGATYDHPFHVTDWVPTLLNGLLGAPPLADASLYAAPPPAKKPAAPKSAAAAALETHFAAHPVASSGLDGVDQWLALAATGRKDDVNATPPREEMLLNIDYLDGSLAFTSAPLNYDVAAIYALGWKYIANSGDLGWYKTPRTRDAEVKLEVLDAASANRRDAGVLVLDANSKFEVSSPHSYLFRVLDDASEQNNLASDHPDVRDGFVGPWWKVEDAPPPLSANCADVGDHELARFMPPEAPAESGESPLRARKRRRLS
ncbi:sulfuric ester hydrolase [Aureococcus anophagefferens]|nr:sulfuric ester hydrolase [Aureococcus anophagefferens]